MDAIPIKLITKVWERKFKVKLCNRKTKFMNNQNGQVTFLKQ